MIVDVVLTVAVIALAAGTIPEFKLRITYIRSPTNRAAVCIGSFGSRCGCFIGAGAGEGDYLGIIGFFCRANFSEKTTQICHPGYRNYIQNIFAKEQEIVGKSN